MRSTTQAALPVRLSPPNHDETRKMHDKLTGVDALDGVKILFLDDTPQFHYPILANLTLATHRRVERIAYHGESLQDLVARLEERMKLCPRPHLLLADGNLDLLPSSEAADPGLQGFAVIAELHRRNRLTIPTMGMSNVGAYRRPFKAAGADGFLDKNLPPDRFVQALARRFARTWAEIHRRREEEFLMSD